jgi:hypothetical protein
VEIKEKNQTIEVLLILFLIPGKSKIKARIKNPIGIWTIKG